MRLRPAWPEAIIEGMCLKFLMEIKGDTNERFNDYGLANAD